MENKTIMSQRLNIEENIFSANDRLAKNNRLKLDNAGVMAINFLASPGAGKTSLIERTIESLV